MVTKNISIDNDCVEKIRPYIDRHNGNFSAAIRDVIDLAEKHGPQLLSIDKTLFEWALYQIEGVLIPDHILDKILEPSLINSMSGLEKVFNKKFDDLKCHISLRYDTDSSPSNVLAEIRSPNSRISKLVALMISQFMVKNNLYIRSVINYDEYIKIELGPDGDRNNISKFFGDFDDIIRNIRNKPDFWKSLMGLHISSNYNMVTVHRDYLEDLLANQPAGFGRIIEILAKKPLQEISLGEKLSLIKEVYEKSKIFDRVEIDKYSVVIFHSFRSKETIERLKKDLLYLLETDGYDIKSTSNIIILTKR